MSRSIRGQRRQKRAAPDAAAIEAEIERIQNFNTAEARSLGYAAVNKKLVIVEDEAETIRLIFQRYLELGSIQALAQELDGRGIVTKERAWSNDRTVGGIRFGVGHLAYLLKNRVYVGEVVHRNEVHAGDHAPILTRELFDAVQAKLASNAVDRTLRLKSSPSLLAGLIFDDCGNKMSPSHTNKRGVRYRYYVSQAVLQRRDGEIGNVTRVSAPEIENIVLAALRKNSEANDADSDQIVVEQNLAKIVMKPNAVEVHLRNSDNEAEVSHHGDPIIVTWAPPPFIVEKGIQAGGEARPPMDSESREALLTAIAKARLWVDEIVHERVESIAGIAAREDKSVRYIRMLMPLAFVSPALLEATIDGATRQLSMTSILQNFPHSWNRQHIEFIVKTT